jgi:hypothetical protein
MNRYFSAVCWAIAMLVLAAGARLGWVDRDAAMTLLLVMPMLAFITLQRRGGCCALSGRDA